MKVLHVLHTSAPYLAGYCTRSSDIFRQQLAAGYELAAVTSAQHPNETGMATESIEGVVYHRTAPALQTKIPLLREAGLMYALYQRLQEVVRAFKPDIIHAHSPVLVGWPAAKVAARFELPIVYEVRDLWENALVAARPGGWRD